MAGRRAAARAVAALAGAGGAAGSRGSSPSWPPGFVGSISHAAGWAAAVVARSEVHRAVGLDLEVSGALPADDAVAVCSAVERTVLSRHAAGRERDAAATLHWAAKEAAFKAWDPRCGGALRGVDPALLAVAFGADGTARALPAPELAVSLPDLPPLSGRWADAGGFVIVVLSAQG